MKCNTYSNELKEQVIHEHPQFGNISLYASQHGISEPIFIFGLENI